MTSNSIIITDLEKKDTGNYGCNATSSIGYVYKDVYINVQCKSNLNLLAYSRNYSAAVLYIFYMYRYVHRSLCEGSSYFYDIFAIP